MLLFGKIKWICFSIGMIVFVFSCNDKKQLHPVSVSDFSTFVLETGYRTDAEKYGWSIIQKSVYDFTTKNGATWQIPNGVDSAKTNYPVTQVSFNDAIAYCEWANCHLPTYDEYWTLVKSDKRTINENAPSILPIDETNIVGNVWDITITENSMKEIRLAGGSLFCNPYSCNGTSPNRKLFVDKETGNIHIGFSVLYD